MLQIAILFNVLNLIPSIRFNKNNNLDHTIFTFNCNLKIVLEYEKDTKSMFTEIQLIMENVGVVFSLTSKKLLIPLITLYF